MRKGFLRCSVFAASLAVLFFGAGCADPTEGQPAAQVNEASGQPSSKADAPAGGQVFTLSDASTVEFVGSKVTGSHDGGFSTFSGTVTVPEGGELTQAQIDTTIDMNSVRSDNDRLTGHLMSADFFDVETYPEATFVSTGITKKGDNYTVSGDLTLHGVTKNISFPAAMALNGDALTATAEFSINRNDFGIVYPGKPDDLIRDGVLLKLNIEAKPAG